MYSYFAQYIVDQSVMIAVVVVIALRATRSAAASERTRPGVRIQEVHLAAVPSPLHIGSPHLVDVAPLRSLRGRPACSDTLPLASFGALLSKSALLRASLQLLGNAKAGIFREPVSLRDLRRTLPGTRT